MGIMHYVQALCGCALYLCWLYRISLLALFGIETTEVNPVSPWVIDSALVILGAILALVSKILLNRREESKVAEKRMQTMEGQLALVSAAVLPISTAFQAMLIDKLTHFHTKEMDALLIKLGPPFNLSEKEEKRLHDMLKEREDTLGDVIDDNEREAAHILPTIIKWAKQEQKNLGPSQIQVVAVPVIPKA